MPTPSADRNLLFGILALQMDFIGRDELVAAMNAWVLDKARSLGDILAQQEALAEADRQLLDALVARHLMRHQDQAQASLAALRVDAELRESLARLGGEVQQSVRSLSPQTAEPPPPTPTREPMPDGASADPVARLARESRYRILRPHARGGLGEVSVALDEELHREVALKQIQERFADHPESRGRFVLEAEITGRLEHPGVVPVYGLGCHADGRPYYAMRFIKGQSLHEAIESYHRGPGGESALALRRLLTRFVAVCDAVAYAHSRGVIHRDIKPANVMLGDYGETLVVDWGLARALATSENETAPFQPIHGSGEGGTQQGQVLGTPAFMPPEQALGRLDQVGAASDIFALGASLYNLLTGRAPYAGPDALAKAQAADYLPPRQVNAGVSRALEAVCLKAMARPVEGRYASARALAQDVERWLADEPVTAWREPLGARARRWVGRHRTAVTAGALGFGLTALGLAVLALVLSAKNQQLNVAREQEEAARVAAQRERDRAREHQRVAWDAVDNWLTRTSEGLSETPQTEQLRRDLLEQALAFHRKLAAQGGDEPEQVQRTAEATKRVGAVLKELGQHAQAEEAFQEALALFDRLPEGSRESAEVRTTRIDTWNLLGVTFYARGRWGEARRAWERGRALIPAGVEGAAERHALAVLANNFGNAWKKEGNLDEAEKEYRRAAELHQALVASIPDEPAYADDLATHYSNLADVFDEAGNERQKKEYLRKAVASARTASSLAPTQARFRYGLARRQFALAFALSRRSLTPEALEGFEEALALLEALNVAFPSRPDYADTYGRALNDLAVAHEKAGKPELALPLLEKAIAAQRRALQSMPDDAGKRDNLLKHFGNLFDVLYARKDHGELAKAARDLARVQPGRGWSGRQAARGFAGCVGLAQADEALTPARREELAGRYAAEALEALEQAVKGGDREWPALLGEPRADAFVKRDEFQRFVRLRGLPALREGAQRAEKRLAGRAEDESIQNEVAGRWHEVATLCMELKRYAEGRRALDRCLEVRRALVRRRAGDRAYSVELAGALCDLGHLISESGKPLDALPLFAEAEKILVPLTKGGAQRDRARLFLEITLQSRRAALVRAGRRVESLPDVERLIELSEGETRAQWLREREFIEYLRLAQLAKAGKHAEAAEEAGRVSERPGASPGGTYNMACVYGLATKAAGDDAAAADRYAAAALRLLKRIAEGGFFKSKSNLDHLSKDGDFDALRKRDDFRRFVQELRR